MVEWHHQLDGHEFEQALGFGDGQAGKSGMLQSMGSQTTGHNLVTEQQQNISIQLGWKVFLHCKSREF